MSIRKLIGANFKLNLSTKAEIVQYFGTMQELTHGYTNADVFFAPQMPFISLVQDLASQCGFHAGSQNSASEISGAFTGESSVDVLSDIGIQYCIVGHGERRTMFGENNSIINKKIKLLLAKNIKPVLCIGESVEQRQEGKTMEVIETQFKGAMEGIDDNSNIDIAYEPLWAIGTGLVPTKEEIQSVHEYIRGLLKNTTSRILYGGSSNDTNAAEFIMIPEVDGFLVGGASLVPEKFAKMIAAIQ